MWTYNQILICFQFYFIATNILQWSETVFHISLPCTLLTNSIIWIQIIVVSLPIYTNIILYTFMHLRGRERERMSSSSTSDGLSARLCTVCLNTVVDDNSRGKADLVCGHLFHLGIYLSFFIYLFILIIISSYILIYFGLIIVCRLHRLRIQLQARNEMPKL